MGRAVALVTASALLLAACAGPSHETVRIDTTPETEPTTLATVASTTTTAAPTATTPATTTATTLLPEDQEAIEALVAVLGAIGTSDPFMPDGDSFHFEAELTRLDIDSPAPADRTSAQWVTVLGVTGDATPTTASFAFNDATKTTLGRVVDDQVWMEIDSEWQAVAVPDAHAEVFALSYGNWAELLVQMVSLTAQFSYDTAVDVVPWEGGQHFTITAATGPDDPLMVAGMPSATHLWVDENAVVRRAQVQGYIVWQGTYLPATLTMQIDQMPAPVIVAPVEDATLSS